MAHNIAIIIPYFGKLPDYFPFFAETCLRNPFIDFLIFTNDEKSVVYAKDNVHIKTISVKEFNELAGQKLQTDVNLKFGYKLCDLRPMYGHIFEDYIKDYSFWGFCDVDILLGDLQKVITEDVLRQNFVISFYEYFISGPFSLFRNCETINFLYKKSKDYKAVIENNNEHYCFDEAGGMDVIRQLWKNIPIDTTLSSTESISHVVMNPEKCPYNTLFQKNIEDRSLDKNDIIWYQDGVLTLNNKEIFVYHYLWNKQSWKFNVPAYRPNQGFYFNRFGLFYKLPSGMTIEWTQSIFKNVHQKILRKLKRLKAKIRS